MSEVLELLASELDERQVQRIADYIGADTYQTQAAIEAALPTLVAAMSRASETDEGAFLMTQHMQQFGGGSLGDLLGGILGRNQTTPSNRSSKPSVNSTEFEEILPPGFETGSADSTRSRKPTNPAPPPAVPSRAGHRDPFESSLGPGNELKPSNSLPLPSDIPLSPSADSRPLDDMLGNVLGNKKKRVEDAIGKSSGLDLRKIGPLLMILAPLVLGAMRSRASSRSSTESLSPKDLSEMMRGERKSIEQKQGGSLIGRMLDQDGDGDFDLSDIIKLGFRSFFGRR